MIKIKNLASCNITKNIRSYINSGKLDTSIYPFPTLLIDIEEKRASIVLYWFKYFIEIDFYKD